MYVLTNIANSITTYLDSYIGLLYCKVITLGEDARTY